MTKKRLLLFRSGKYVPQGEFSAQDVKNIFATGSKAPAVYIHSSHFKKDPNSGVKEPPVLGEFSNITVEEKDGVATAYGDLEFNEKGVGYLEDGIIGGVSVEIPNKELKKIALLPKGVNPAVKGGSEFQADNSVYFEFEEPVSFEFADQTTSIATIIEDINKLDVSMISKEALSLLSSAVYAKTDIKYYIEKLKSKGYTVEKAAAEFEGSEFEGLTPEEIVAKATERATAAARAEFEAGAEAKEKAAKFMEDHKTKITPAMKEAGLNAEFMEYMYRSGYEFQEGGLVEIIEGIVKNIPGITTGKQTGGASEFQGDNALDRVKIVSEVM